MLKFIQAIMEKSEWRRKLADDTIRTKWEKESGLRKEVFEYAIEELKYWDNSKDETNGIEASGVDLVWVSVFIISIRIGRR